MKGNELIELPDSAQNDSERENRGKEGGERLRLLSREGRHAISPDQRIDGRLLAMIDCKLRQPYIVVLLLSRIQHI